jgi:hypothetical protein
MTASRKEDSKVISYDILTEQGRYNIDQAIKNYHKKLNTLMPIDVIMAGIAGAATASILYSWTAPFFLAAGDLAVKYFVRNGRDQVYQQQLDLLIKIYSDLLKQHGAKITTNERFLEMMEIIQDCLPCDTQENRRQTRSLLYPIELNNYASYTALSEKYKRNLSESPLHLDLIPPPPPPPLPKPEPSFLSRLIGTQEVEPKKATEKPEEKPEERPATMEENTSGSSLLNFVNKQHIWCKFYGYNPPMLDVQPVKSVSEELTNAASSVAVKAMSIASKRA